MSRRLPPIRGTSPIADIGYPATIMPAMFLAGCTFRCPYCLNRELVLEKNLQELDASQILSEYVLSGERWVMISGAEPFKTPGLIALLEEAQSMHLNVALATNGSYPDHLEVAVNRSLVNHVVMDVKTGFDPVRYAQVTGMSGWFGRVKESFDFLVASDVETDFRMTACSKFVCRDDVMEVAEAIGMGGILVLQPYRWEQTLDPEMADPDLAVPYETLQEWAAAADPLVWKAIIREV